MVKCLVTGGTGFVGSHIVRLLVEREHDVSVLLREDSNTHLIGDLNFQRVVGDVTNPITLDKGITDDIDWLFHNAAVMADWGGRSHFFPVNVEGTRNVLEEVRKKDIPRLVFTSSTAVYGFPNKDEPITEGTPWNPMNAYQKSKAESEALVRKYITDYGIKASMVRAPVVVGQGDMFTGPQLIERLKNENMVVFSGGKNLQSYCHGEDFANCLIITAEKGEVSHGEAYNVKSFDCTMREFVEVLADELGVKKKFMNIPYRPAVAIGAVLGGLYRAFNKKKAPPITSFRVKMFGSKYLIDTSKVKDELGYEPKWNLKRTVKDMVDWGGFVRPR